VGFLSLNEVLIKHQFFIPLSQWKKMIMEISLMGFKDLTPREPEFSQIPINRFLFLFSGLFDLVHFGLCFSEFINI
jgi:hypothetical protein